MCRLSQSAAFFHCEILVDLEIKFSRAFLLIFEDYFYFDSYIIDIFSEKICSLLRTRSGFTAQLYQVLQLEPALHRVNVYRLHVMWQFEESVGRRFCVTLGFMMHDLIFTWNFLRGWIS